MPATIDLARLDRLADERRQTLAAAEAAHAAVLAEVRAILEAGGDLVNVAELAERAGLSRATVYNRVLNGRTTDQ